MDIYESKKQIEVVRKETVCTSTIRIGDQIRVGHYTATCQEITPKGALFLMDQYLDQDYQMNRESTNIGGYYESDLRRTINSEEVLAVFGDLRERMTPFDNGDLLRIPFRGEIFGEEGAEIFEPDSCQQWPLMNDIKNRITFRKNHNEWGWLQNRRKISVEDFCYVSMNAHPYSINATCSMGVCLVFLIN